MSLTKRTLLSVSVISMSGMLTLSLTMANKFKTSSYNSLESKVQTVLGFTTSTAATYIWNFDMQGLGKLGEQLTKENEIKVANFYDKDNKPLLKPIEISNSLKIMKEKILNQDGATIGFAELAYSTESIDQIVKSTYLTVLVIAVIAQALLTFGTYWFVGRSSKRIEQTLEQLRDTANQTSETSEVMMRISTDIQNRGSGQAASVEQTSATLHEITSIVNQNAEASKHALKEAQDSFKSAQDGEREIGSLYKAMLDISASAKRIEDVTQVVDDIAFQINLLALNAAVEAARAGEQGKGFAVVADAVRSLAQRSATAAKDINLLIKESVSKIDNGNHIVESNRAVLANLLSSAEKVKDINSEIANSSKEQAAGIGQISQAMSEIDSKANEAAKSSEEATIQAQKLSEQSALLREIINTFESEIIGDHHRNIA